MAELDAEQLAAALAALPPAPTDIGTLETVVQRPTEGARVRLDVGSLDTGVGLVGDRWASSTTRTGGAPDPDRMLTIANAAVALAVADGDADHALGFGDQLLVDLDLSEANLPAGSVLRVGDAVVEVTAAPHLGCVTFRGHYGSAALKAVNTAEGRAARLRGCNARVLEPGQVRPGDAVTVVSRPGDRRPGD